MKIQTGQYIFFKDSVGLDLLELEEDLVWELEEEGRVYSIFD